MLQFIITNFTKFDNYMAEVLGEQLWDFIMLLGFVGVVFGGGAFVLFATLAWLLHVNDYVAIAICIVVLVWIWLRLTAE